MLAKTLLKQLFLLTLAAYILTLSACETLGSMSSLPQAGFINHYANGSDYYLALADQSQAPQKQAYQLKAAGRYLQDRDAPAAEQLLDNVDDSDIPESLMDEKSLLQANLSLMQDRALESLDNLETIKNPTALPVHLQKPYYELLAMDNAKLGHPLLSAEARMTLDPLLSSESARTRNRNAIWKNLQQLTSADLVGQLRQTTYGQLHGWLEIAYIFKQYASNPELFSHEVRLWQQNYPQHPAHLLLPQPKNSTSGHWFTSNAKKSQKTGIPGLAVVPNRISAQESLHVALLLPTSGSLASSGEAIRQGFMTAYYKNQDDNEAPRSINVYNTAGKNIGSVYRKAINDGANFIVGPLTKKEVLAIEKFGKLPVPTLALNYTPLTKAPHTNLFEFALSPQDEARQVAVRASQDSRSHALVIAPTGSWGDGIANAFTNAWQSGGGTVVDTLTYSKKTNLDQAMKKLLQVQKSSERTSELKRLFGKKLSSVPQRRQDIDMVFLVANAQTARLIRPLLRFYYAADVPIYTTSLVYTGTPNPMNDRDLDGILFCDAPWVLQNNQEIKENKQQMHDSMPNIGQKESRLFAFGFDAYTLILLLNQTSYDNMASIPAMTGTLYLGSQNQRIFRELDWAKFKQGLPEKSA